MTAIQTPGRGESIVMDSRQPRPGTDQCIHDLLATSCIWCTPRPGVEDLDVDLDERGTGARPAGRRPLAASFYGLCKSCDGQIAPGDTVYRRGTGEAVAYDCEDCADV